MLIFRKIIFTAESCNLYVCHKPRPAPLSVCSGRHVYKILERPFHCRRSTVACICAFVYFQCSNEGGTRHLHDKHLHPKERNCVKVGEQTYLDPNCIERYLYLCRSNTREEWNSRAAWSETFSLTLPSHIRLERVSSGDSRFLITCILFLFFLPSLFHRRRSRSGRSDFQKVYFHHELFATDFRSNNYSRLNK